MLICAGLMFLAHAVANATQAVLLIAAGSLCVALAGPTAYVLTMDLGGQHTATVFSVMNTAGNVGAMLCPLAVAWLVDWTQSWQLVLLVFGGVYVASALCWMFLNPDRPIVEDRDANLSGG